MEESEIIAKIAELKESKQRRDAELQANQSILDDMNAQIEKIRAEMRKRLQETEPIQARMRSIKNDDWNSQREIERLEKLYREQQTKKQTEAAELERLSAELEWYEKLAKEKAWGPFAFQHQREAAVQFATAKRGHSKGSRAICGDQMGLGKTMTCLVWADVVEANKIAIFTPKPVLKTFLQEIGRWAPHRDPVAIGLANGKAQRDAQLSWIEHEDQFTILVNYEAWRKDKEFIQKLIDLKIDTVICDEAHVMADKKGNAFRGISELVWAQNVDFECENCGHTYTRPPMGHWCRNCNKPIDVSPWSNCSVKNIMTMSGTLIKNKPQDFWPQLFLMDRSHPYFNREGNYLNNYCTQVQHTSLYSRDPVTGDPKDVWRWEFLPGAEARLIKEMGPSFLQRNRDAAGITLPKQEKQVHYLEFDGENYTQQEQAVHELTNYFMVLLGGEGNEVVAVNTIAKYIKLRLLNEFPGGLKVENPDPENTNRFLGIKESIKLDYAVDLIREAVDSGKRTVVFSHFTTALHDLNRRLLETDIASCEFHGGTNEKRRAEVVADFNRKVVEENGGNYKWDVVCTNYRSGGVGLNLTAATNVICLGEEWSPKMEGQALARVDRIGQTEQTTVHVLRIRNTIDEWMGEIMDQKKRMGEDFDKEAQTKAFIEKMRTLFQEGK